MSCICSLSSSWLTAGCPLVLSLRLNLCHSDLKCSRCSCAVGNSAPGHDLHTNCLGASDALPYALPDPGARALAAENSSLGSMAAGVLRSDGKALAEFAVGSAAELAVLVTRASSTSTAILAADFGGWLSCLKAPGGMRQTASNTASAVNSRSSLSPSSPASSARTSAASPRSARTHTRICARTMPTPLCCSSSRITSSDCCLAVRVGTTA
mmetsp:Transcript_15500/g.39370  ORF Transcript_15500/g.39370 Transcript_15500/m.39370 type:complete len:211 (-) Transcript_15500:496-1128(-)